MQFDFGMHPVLKTLSDWNIYIIGTFITLDICILRLEATGLIDVRTIVEKIRSQRAHSIQTPDQYVFCHLALLEYAESHSMVQDVDLAGFDSDTESD